MTEPVREQFLEAVVGVVIAALAVPQSWGTFPAGSVERTYQIAPTLSNRWRICVVDGDGSHSPTPEDRDGAIDDAFAFDVLVQVQGDDVNPPGRWGNRALDTIKRALRAGVASNGVLGALWPYTKQPITFDPEAAVLFPDGAGRFAEFILPCTAQLPDNLGGGA